VEAAAAAAAAAHLTLLLEIPDPKGRERGEMMLNHTLWQPNQI